MDQVIAECLQISSPRVSSNVTVTRGVLQSALVSKPLILAPVMVEAEVVSLLVGEAKIHQEHVMMMNWLQFFKPLSTDPLK